MTRGIYRHKPLSEEHKQKISKSLIGKKKPPRSEGYKKNISKSHKGQITWMKGKHHTVESKEKLSKSHKGKSTWSKGITFPEEARKNMSEAHKRKYGELSSNWKGGKTSLVYTIRNSFKYRQWRDDIYTKDNFTCQECGDDKGGNLEAHHIKTLSYILQKYEITNLKEALECEELWNINNGITLCKDCHKFLYQNSKRKGVKEK